MKKQKDIHAEYMVKAINLAKRSVAKGGGPFGAVIVKDGVIVAQGSNCVTLNNDPTAHAEVITIRKACKKLQTFDLSGCEIYTSCEPCPMCLSAIYWAHIDKIYYGCTKDDAKDIGFDDSFIYDQIDLKPEKRSIPAANILRDQALGAFRLWDSKEDKTEY
ncbi:guanine deaminase [Dysgonomonas sp. PFB1-18]|uniref:nucleoside deaminase n=1 Tax=unclassified Dysgonomonas TaxID=2630389 RepID=UPI0024752B94|nr:MULTISPECIES: nucleoside deaminase [unclassified Dysgonomonas]MDH6310766.1 guanine deaminase [Dysgonomonas sp. PF1-14]MDH6340616.1 guanine deaminase [Dysgonomonas sp. PF1-16]MDH6382277.1 guanine deaminase [Dysgonomonas sp. PFB1-18]MDH6399586.1 guanine deaminase [Dysgonomonas sp. PF1-23]